MPDRTDTRSNRILASLPDAERVPLVQAAVRRARPAGDSLWQAGDEVRSVHFPVAGLASLTVSTADGMSVEVAMVGPEGVVGVPEALGSRTAATNAVYQIAGAADEIEVNVFRERAVTGTALHEALLRHAEFLFVSSSQTSACNRLHDIEQRAARWLVDTRQRLGTDRFVLTQEFFATMLGVHRPSVSIAAGNLADEGLIEYHRGHLTILEPDRLAERSCECWPVLRRELGRLLEPVTVG